MARVNTKRLLGRLASAALLSLVALAAVAAPQAETRIGFFHVNDVYQLGPIDPVEQRGGLARLATIVKSVREHHPATLFTFGGDTLSPSLESSLFEGRQMIVGWNALGVDVAVPGNHEFDLGPEIFVKRVAESRFTWLAANLKTADGGPVPGVLPYVVKNVGGVAVGLVGLIVERTPEMSSPGKNLRFTRVSTAARNAVRALRAKGAQVIVGLTHVDIEDDRLLAGTGMFDLILGGHDHQIITEVVGKTPILKAGSDVRDALFVRMRLAKAADGRTTTIRGIEWDLIPVDKNQAEDPQILALAKSFDVTSDIAMAEVIGETTVVLDGRSQTVRRMENALGNFVADAVRAYAGSDIALVNGGGLRGDRVFEPGPIARMDIKRMLPFENPIVVLSITGGQLREALEHGLDLVATYGQSGAMPQVSGLRVRYDPAKEKGSRVTGLMIAGQPVSPDQHYTLATSAYLSRGGDGYQMFKELPVLRSAESSLTETDVAISAVSRAGRIAPVVDGRMERVR